MSAAGWTTLGVALTVLGGVFAAVIKGYVDRRTAREVAAIEARRVDMEKEQRADTNRSQEAQQILDTTRLLITEMRNEMVILRADLVKIGAENENNRQRAIKCEERALKTQRRMDYLEEQVAQLSKTLTATGHLPHGEHLGHVGGELGGHEHEHEPDLEHE